MAKPYGWLKLWCEARNDKKLAALSDAEHRVWLHLLCLAGEQRGELRGSFPVENMRLLALEVSNGAVPLLEQTIAHMEALEMGRAQDGRWWFKGWDERQYDKPSDRPEQVRERVRRYRERQEGVTSSVVTPSNAVKRTEKSREEDIRVDIPPTPLAGEAPGGAAGAVVSDDESRDPESRRASRAANATAGVDGEADGTESRRASRAANATAGSEAADGPESRCARPAEARAGTVRRSAAIRHGIPADWTPGDGVWQWARGAFPGVTDPQLAAHAVEFRDYWRADGRPKKDWDLTWRNGLKRFDPRTPPRGGNK